MMMNVDKGMILKLLSQMPDDAVVKAFQAATGGSAPHGMDNSLDGMAADDEDNKVKGWSELTFQKLKDDRPALADKNYILDKEAQQVPIQALGIPHDEAEGAYSMGAGGGGF